MGWAVQRRSQPLFTALRGGFKAQGLKVQLVSRAFAER